MFAQRVQVQPIDHILQEGELFIHFFLFIVRTPIREVWLKASLWLSNAR